MNLAIMYTVTLLSVWLCVCLAIPPPVVRPIPPPKPKLHELNNPHQKAHLYLSMKRRHLNRPRKLHLDAHELSKALNGVKFLKNLSFLHHVKSEMPDTKSANNPHQKAHLYLPMKRRHLNRPRKLHLDAHELSKALNGVKFLKNLSFLHHVKSEMPDTKSAKPSAGFKIPPPIVKPIPPPAGRPKSFAGFKQPPPPPPPPEGGGGSGKMWKKSQVAEWSKLNDVAEELLKKLNDLGL